jgi:hypothetical protein
VASDIAQQPVGDLCVARTRFESPSVGSTAFVAHSGTDLVHIRANVTCIACFCTGRIHKMTMCTLDASSSCLIMLLVTDAACDAYCLSSQVIVPPGAACCTHRHPRNTGISSHATFTACIEVTDRKPSCAAVGTGYCSDGLSHLSRVTVQTSGQSILRGKLPQNTVDADTQCGVRSRSCGAVETGRCSGGSSEHTRDLSCSAVGTSGQSPLRGKPSQTTGGAPSLCGLRNRSLGADVTGRSSSAHSGMSRVTVHTRGQSRHRGKLPRNTADTGTPLGVRSLSCGAVDTGR